MNNDNESPYFIKKILRQFVTLIYIYYFLFQEKKNTTKQTKYY